MSAELSDLLVQAFLFTGGIIFMLLAFWRPWPENVMLHAIAGILLWVLAVIVPMTETTYYPAGWAFLIMGMMNIGMGLVFGVGGLYEIWTTESWEQEEDIDYVV